MSSPFFRSMRVLEGEGFRRSLAALTVAGVLLGLWTAWFLFATVTIHEVSTGARLDLEQSAYSLQAPSEGRIVFAGLVLGREVREGEILVELDSTRETLALEEQQTRLAALTPRIEALRFELAADDRALVEARQTAALRIAEAEAQCREAEAAVRMARDELDRLTPLAAAGQISEVDLERARAEAQKRQASTESVCIAVRRLEREQTAGQSDRDARIQSLKGQIKQLEGETSTAGAAVARLTDEIDRRRIRAPGAGRLGEIAPIQVGGYVAEGDKLGTILPSSSLLVSAEFPPERALGRIRPGQPALLRLDGFPWAEYGAPKATVSTVAGEVRDGKVKVELAIDPRTSGRIPLQHGLPGSVEIEIERLTPAALVLRAAGKLLASPSGSAPAPARVEETR